MSHLISFVYWHCVFISTSFFSTYIFNRLGRFEVSPLEIYIIYSSTFKGISWTITMEFFLVTFCVNINFHRNYKMLPELKSYFSYLSNTIEKSIQISNAYCAFILIIIIKFCRKTNPIIWANTMLLTIKHLMVWISMYGEKGGLYYGHIYRVFYNFYWIFGQFYFHLEVFVVWCRGFFASNYVGKWNWRFDLFLFNCNHKAIQNVCSVWKIIINLRCK